MGEWVGCLVVGDSVVGMSAFVIIGSVVGLNVIMDFVGFGVGGVVEEVVKEVVVGDDDHVTRVSVSVSLPPLPQLQQLSMATPMPPSPSTPSDLHIAEEE